MVATVSSHYSSDMQPPLCFEYEFDKMPILTYRTFNITYFTIIIMFNLKEPDLRPGIIYAFLLGLGPFRTRALVPTKFKELKEKQPKLCCLDVSQLANLPRLVHVKASRGNPF